MATVVDVEKVSECNRAAGLSIGVTAVPPGSTAHLIVRCWKFGVSPFAGERRLARYRF